MSLFYLPSQEVIVSRVWRLLTKHSKAMKNGRLFIELGKGTNSDYQMTIINAQITSKCLVFFTARISNFFPILVNFFQRHAPLAQPVEQQPFKLLVRGSNPRRGTMGELTSILSFQKNNSEWGNGRLAHYNIGPSTMVGNSNGQRTACKAGACRFDSDLYLQKFL